MIRDPIEEADEEPPPCERPYQHVHLHPRYPSGWCVECGAPPESGCRLRDEEWDQ